MNRLFQFGVLTAVLLAMLSVPVLVGAQEEAAADPVAETETSEVPGAEDPTEDEIAETADTEDAMVANQGPGTPPEPDPNVNAADYWSAYETDEIAWTLNNLWIMICGCLVFIMHLGFASLECGLTRQKNTINILFKNTMIISIGL